MTKTSAMGLIMAAALGVLLTLAPGEVIAADVSSMAKPAETPVQVEKGR